MLLKKLFFAIASLAFIIFITATPAKSAPATGPQPWGFFGFGPTDSFAEECDAFLCAPSAGGNSFFLGAPPWTFNGSGFLIVQDLFFSGDQFRIFDNGSRIGDTSSPNGTSISCDTDPVICFENAGMSSGIFPLGPGNHSIVIQVIASPFSTGVASLCIDAGDVECGVPLLSFSLAQFDASGTDGDPVNTFTGELFNQLPPDLGLGGPMPLSFSRYYASGLLNANIIGSLGDNWRHNFEWSLSVSGTVATITSDKGRIITFSDNGASWDLTGTMNIPFQFVESGSDFVLYDPSTDRLYTFDSAGVLTKIEDGKGNTHALTYTGGDLTTVSDGLGRTLKITYSGGNLSTVTDGTRTVSFAYMGYDLTQVTDALGNITTYAYDSGGLMTSATLPAGNTPFSQTWNGSGQVESQTDSDGNTTTFAYTGLDTTVIDALGNNGVHSHSTNGELTKNQNQAGQSLTVGYDAAGRRTTMTDRSGNTITNTYDSTSGQLTTLTLPSGSANFTYTPRVDSSGVTHYDQTGVIYPDGTTEAFTYDASGNMTSHTDQRLNTRSFSYDANGLRIKKINKLGGLYAYTYNADGTFATRTDPTGNTTTFGYDAMKRVNLVTFSDGTTRAYARDDQNRLTSETDERGNSTTLTYDANNKVASVTDTLGVTTTFAYDGNDRLISITDPLGNVYSRTFDELGRLNTFTDGNGNFATLGYDPLGNITSITDAAGNVWLSTYNADGFLLTTSDPLGNTLRFTRDTQHRVTRSTTALGHTNEFAYNVMGRITSSTDPLGNVTFYTYDANRQIASVILPDGASTTYARNALGQVTRLTDPAGNNWDRAYDNMGRRTSVTDPLGNITSLSYDTSNRASFVTFPGIMGTLEFTNDAAGNATRMLYSDGTDLTFTFDANGRVTAANGIAQAFDSRGQATESNGILITRDAGGRITSMTLAAGKTVNYTYDANDNLTEVIDWLGGISSFSYDAANRLISMTRPNFLTTVNAYDDDNRLIEIDEGAISRISLTRDAKGQITEAIRDVPLPATAATIADSVHTFDAASQVEAFTYDGLGRLTDDGVKSFTWDLASRLTSYTVGGSAVEATYDALGYRITRATAAGTRNFFWNKALGLPSISIERQGGADFLYYVHTPSGDLLYSIDAATDNRRFYHFDEMGNTIFITDDAGVVTGSYAYSPFGAVTASSGGLDNPFTWQGEKGVMDEGNGLFYMRARYYDSALGRFIIRDPRKRITPITVNPYQYAMLNPLLFIDPTGEQGQSKDGDFEGSTADKVIEGTTNSVSYFTDVVEPGAKSIAERSLKEATSVRSSPGNTRNKDKLLRKLWRDIDQADKLAKNMDKLGKAGDSLSAGATAIKTAKRLNKVHERGQAGRATALEGQNVQLDELNQLIKGIRKGKISAAMAEKLFKDIQASFDDEVFGAGFRELIDTKIEALVGFKETLVGLAGPWADAADAALEFFGFGDPACE